MNPLGVGDVLAVNTGSGWTSRLIRLGAALRDRPNLANHVVIAHHVDKRGTWWGIEGRPGGVGWADLTRYLAEPQTAGNGPQVRTDAQRQAIATCAEGLLKVGYDWVGGITADLAADLGFRRLPTLLDRWWGWGSGPRPAHVVCSSLAAWVYRQVGLAHPSVDTEETCQPTDWWAWNEAKGWLT